MEVRNIVYHIEPFNGYSDIQICEVDGNFAINVKGKIILKDRVLGAFEYLCERPKKGYFKSLEECEEWLNNNNKNV